MDMPCTFCPAAAAEIGQKRGERLAMCRQCLKKHCDGPTDPIPTPESIQEKARRYRRDLERRQMAAVLAVWVLCILGGWAICAGGVAAIVGFLKFL